MNIKIKTETVVSVALGVLGLAQAVLSHQKEANDKKALKAELVEEVMKQMSNKE